MYTDYIEDENSEDYYDDQGNDNKDKIKKIILFVGIFVIALILVVVLAKSCSKRNDGEANAPENNHTPSVIISLENVSLAVGDQREIQADVLMSSGEKVVGWYSEDSSIATIDDNGGLKGIITGVKEGTTNIIVSYRENGEVYTNRCQVTVTSSQSALENIEFVQESISVARGSNVLLEIKTSPADAKVEDIVYVSDNPDIASVSDEGRITGVQVGTTTITVSALDGAVSDTITVNVIEKGPTTIDPTSLQINGLSNGLKVNGTAQIDFKVLPENATNKSITWTSTNPNVATVNSDGVVTGVSAGTCTIVGATSNNVSARLEVTVESDVIPVSSISINDANPFTMNVGGTYLLKYTISPDNATNKNVIYTTSDRNVVYVNSYGIMAALKAGTATITITTEDGQKTASLVVNVKSSSSKTSSTVESSGSSSSGSSSSSGQSVSSFSSSSNSSKEDISCTNALMTNITHNGSSKGAIISSNSFSNAKAFTNMTVTPTITFNGIADCLDQNRIYYKVYYGTTSSNISTVSNGGSGNVRLNSTIPLKNGNGYYRIQIQGYAKKSSSTYYTKNYYAIVNNTTTDNVKPIVSSISYTKLSTTKIRITSKINESGTGIKNIKYCFTALASCTPTTTFRSFTSSYPKSSAYSVSVDLTNVSLPTFKNICMNATDVGGNTSVTTCKGIK